MKRYVILIICSIILLVLSGCKLREKREYNKFLSNYDLVDIPQIQGEKFVFDKKDCTSCISLIHTMKFDCTIYEFNENLNNLYNYLVDNFGETLCYYVNKNTFAWFTTYNIRFSSELEQHKQYENDTYIQYEFFYSSTNKIEEESHSLKNRCYIILGYRKIHQEGYSDCIMTFDSRMFSTEVLDLDKEIK